MNIPTNSPIQLLKIILFCLWNRTATIGYLFPRLPLDLLKGSDSPSPPSPTSSSARSSFYRYIWAWTERPVNLCSNYSHYSEREKRPKHETVFFSQNSEMFSFPTSKNTWVFRNYKIKGEHPINFQIIKEDIVIYYRSGIFRKKYYRSGCILVQSVGS